MNYIKKFKDAFKGLHLGFNQQSIIIQCGLGLGAFIVLYSLKISYIEWLIFVVVVGLVLVSEWINSCIELVVDYISLDIHPQAKKIKDLSAGMVLLSCIIAVVVGVMILYNHR